MKNENDGDDCPACGNQSGIYADLENVMGEAFCCKSCGCRLWVDYDYTAEDYDLVIWLTKKDPFA